MSHQRSFFSRTWRYALVLLLVFGFLAPNNRVAYADPIRVINPALPATFAWPSWWSDSSTCDGTYYNSHKTQGDDAHLLSTSPESTWRNIQACGPRPQDMNGYDVQVSFGAGTDQLMFECVELAKRYLYVAYGAAPTSANASDMAASYANSYPTKFQLFQNGVDTVFPQEGDVVSMTSSDPNGHVAIVTGLYVDTPGNGYITLIDQNGSTGGSFQLSISDYVVQDEVDQGLGFHPTYWVHPLIGIENSPSSSYSTEIGDIAADNSNVWIAGNDNPYYRRPAIWRWDGSNWSQYSPYAPGGSNVHHYLHDITIDSNGGIWAVGEYLSYNQGWQRYTLTYKWNPSSNPPAWERKVSDNYSLLSQNYLNAVSDDGSGNVYAAGYSVVGGSSTYPLLLKWNLNLNKFENQYFAQIPNGQLTDISFSSASNGWAVGFLGSLTTTTYAYHYDGTSWSLVTLPNGIRIQKIKAISDTEAWGVDNYSYGGSATLARIFHYTASNGWQQVYSESNAVFTNIVVNPTHIWAVGSHFVTNYQQPYVRRLIGPNDTNWQEVYMKTFTYGGTIRGAAFVGDYVWLAGDRPTTSNLSGARSPFAIVK